MSRTNSDQIFPERHLTPSTLLARFLLDAVTIMTAMLNDFSDGDIMFPKIENGGGDTISRDTFLYNIRKFVPHPSP